MVRRVDKPVQSATAVREEVRGVDPRQDDFEAAALAVALDLDLSVLAICRGTQLLNVACGGTLHQHIEALEREKIPYEVVS